MKRIVGACERLWLPALPARRLAALRILVGGFALWGLWSGQRALEAVARTPLDLYRPVGPAVLHGPLDPRAFHWLLWATLLLGALFVVGLRFRWTGPLFAVLFLWTTSYRNSWGMIYHSSNLVVLHVIVLALAPAADALSCDALLGSRRRTGRRARTTPPHAARDATHWRYGWPVRLMGSLTAATYWLAGVAKVAGPLGWGWASGAALRSYVVRDGLRKELLGDGATAATFMVHEHPLVLTAAAVLALVLELGAPAALLDRRLGRLWAVLVWGMHVGIRATMGIVFAYQLSGIAFASFFPLERLLGRRSPTARSAASCSTASSG